MSQDETREEMSDVWKTNLRRKVKLNSQRLGNAQKKKRMNEIRFSMVFNEFLHWD
jgi:hypothetical protein